MSFRMCIAGLVATLAATTARAAPPLVPAAPVAPAACAATAAPVVNKAQLSLELEDLRDALNYPERWGKDLAEATRLPFETRANQLDTVPNAFVESFCQGEAVAPLVAFPGEETKPGEKPGSPGDCLKARLRLHPQGNVSYNAAAEQGTWCLDKQAEAGNWGPRVVVQMRRSLQHSLEAKCFIAQQNVAYRVPEGQEGDPTLVVRVWSSVPEEVLQGPRKQAVVAVENQVRAIAQARTYREWADKLFKEYDPAKLEATFTQFDTDTRKKIITATTFDKVDGEGVVAALEQLKADIKALASLKGLNATMVCSFSSHPEKHGELRSPLLRAKDLQIDLDSIETVLRDVAITYQPVQQQWVPWPVHEGQLLAHEKGFRVILLPANLGRMRSKEKFKAGEKPLVFAYDLQRDLTQSKEEKPQESGASSEQKTPGDGVVLIRGEKVQQQASEVGAILARLLVLSAKGLGTPLAAQQEKLDTEAIKEEIEKLKKGVGTAKEPLRLGQLRDLGTLIRLQLSMNATPSGVNLTLYRNAFRRFMGKEPPNQFNRPVSRYTSKVILGFPLDEATSYEARICRGVETCEAKTADDKVIAAFQFETQDTFPLVSIGLEASYGIALNNQPVGGYAFEEISTARGPDRFFQLRAREGIKHSVSFSPLLLIRPCRSWWGLGVGPTWFQGTESAFLNQWNARFIFSHFEAKDVFGSLGLSVRSVRVPAYVTPGAIVAVPEGQSAPAFASSEGFSWMVTLGVGVDLNILAEASRDVAKLFKGKEDSGSKSEGKPTELTGNTSKKQETNN